MTELRCASFCSASPPPRRNMLRADCTRGVRLGIGPASGTFVSVGIYSPGWIAPCSRLRRRVCWITSAGSAARVKEPVLLPYVSDSCDQCSACGLGSEPYGSCSHSNTVSAGAARGVGHRTVIIHHYYRSRLRRRGPCIENSVSSDSWTRRDRGSAL
jgi:hypothetical protein